MDLKEKVRILLILGFFAWGTSLGIRFQAAWDALAMYVLGFIIMRYDEK